MGKGLSLSIKKGAYKPLTITTQSQRKCLEPEFQEALRSVQRSAKEDVFPEVEFDPENEIVTFRKYENGKEILGASHSIHRGRISKKELKRLEHVVEKLHESAEDVTMPTDKRAFFKNFRLPDPLTMPECWRVTGGWFQKRLCVLWGIERDGGGATFLPTSSNSIKLDGTEIRRPIGSMINAIKKEHVAGISSNTNPIGEAIEEDKNEDISSSLPPDTSIEAENIEGSESSKKRGKSCLMNLLGILLILIISGLVLFLLANLTPMRGCSSKFRNSPHNSNNKHHQDGGGNEGGNSPDITPPRPIDGGKEGNNNDNKNTEGIGKKEGGNEGGNSSDITPPRPIDGGKEDNNNDDKNTEGIGKKEDGANPPDIQTPPINAAQIYSFKIVAEIDKSDTTSDVASVTFSVTPMVDLRGNEFQVSDWTINSDIKVSGIFPSFTPKGGLRYSETYQISATVTVDGKTQRVEPYQWNAIGEPAWQILEKEFDPITCKRRYEVICCNSSLIEPSVKSWNIKFRGAEDGNQLNFKVEQESIGNTQLGLRRDIGFYQGAYLMDVAIELEYELPNIGIKKSSYEETFPFSHDSSVDGLKTAKYSVAIPNVYFCLATLEDGTKINGTAFAISETQLLTNYHVAVGGIPDYVEREEYKIVGPVELMNGFGKTFYAKVSYQNREQDVVILKLCDQQGQSTSNKMPGYLHLATDENIKSIKQSEKRHAFAVGYPQGTAWKGPPAFTDGNAEEVRSIDGVETIVHYTNIKKGYSGGPLIDYETGTVLGINFGGLVKVEDGHKPASLATSVSEIRQYLKRDK
ncbi:MAG: trypsin-like peptidase domain-containing protein [Kiritimatiellae bacterium]|nr:trypsin-like peptidase domain-containing protein [Kiritimatiellia bacterium]